MKRTRSFSDPEQSCSPNKRHETQGAGDRIPRALPLLPNSPCISKLTAEALESLQRTLLNKGRSSKKNATDDDLEEMAGPPTPRSAYPLRSRGRYMRRDTRSTGSRTPSPSKKPTPQTYRKRNMRIANVFVEDLTVLPPAIDKEVRLIFGLEKWDEQIILPKDRPDLDAAVQWYKLESQRNARQCALEGDWKASLHSLVTRLSGPWAHELMICTSEKIWNPLLNPTGSSPDDPQDNGDDDTHTPSSAQIALPIFDPNVATTAATFPGHIPSLPPSVSSVAATGSTEARNPCHISTPKPDITVGLDNDVFEPSQLWRLVDYQASGSILSDPYAAEMGMRFPCFVVETKGYSLAASLVSAQNQAAISGAAMLTILRDLNDLATEHTSAAASGSIPQEVPAVCISIVTLGPIHELNVHFMHNNAFHMHCLESCRTTLDAGSEKLVAFLLLIIEWVRGRHKDSVVKQLACVPKHDV